MLAVLSQDFNYFHYTDGTMVIDKVLKAKISGPIVVEFLGTANITTIAGMHIQGTTETPFALVAKINKFVQDGDNIEIEANCTEAYWGTRYFAATGSVKINGTWNEAYYHATCDHPKTRVHWEIHALGKHSNCSTYSPEEAAVRSKTLIGQAAEVFRPVHVLNYAIIGHPYIPSFKDCAAYIPLFVNATETKPGFAVVGIDGAHCGIIDKEGDKFIHTNPVTKKVSETPLAMINNFFKNGYIIKDYTC